MNDGLARKKFTEFKERNGRISDAELDEYWASLQPATIADMIGEWRGGEFDTGHRMNGRLDKARWFGKTFTSATDVQPLVCLDADGKKFSNVERGKGEASLWMEQFRGEITATMVYDGQPVHDHFKKIDDDAVMGIMNGKGVLDFRDGVGRYYYFYLERV
ncbi:hypothetical protein JMUB5695_00239 [Mycobacterium heckeshornense]|uniref:DUF4334 domain-containing protein n=1 Tax=Mycobacterium heckeshornense TaxID=110505 RepID=UPI0019447F6D|nr:DUF4334 domain-containing protein [Mycobacterium heckeshornense]BCQ06829.1 hypothetical protein JMUB5695_00239 [Mycobacterium heckeshornense]